MHNSHAHIITTAGWHTAFNSKERAGELQEKLSRWCRWQMPREINAVFDRLCPADQVWRISTAALDLGTIDLDDFETTLTARFRSRLYEEIKKLVYYAGRPGDSAIEVVDRYTSLLETIRNFLLTGCLPWNGQPMQGSVSSWIELELRHNRQQVIGLIRQLAAGNVQVRKRIAWQTEDTCIRRIVEGLEPANHTEITGFADEMVKLQKNSPVVKASTGDFSKNLWLWILNYLLDEKGTLFNKAAFLRSNIRQMAAHYNVQYAQLLELIKKAVAIVQQKNGIKTSFVNMLLLITQDTETVSATANAPHAADDYWQQLKTLLSSTAAIKSSSGSALLNQLLVNLCHEDRQKMQRLLDAAALPVTCWALLVPKLSEEALEVLLHCLAPANAGILQHTVLLLHDAAKASQLVVGRAVLWQAALQLLYSRRSSGCSGEELMEHCVKALAAAKNMDPLKVYSRLSGAPLPHTLYSPAVLEAFDIFSSSCRKRLGGQAGETARRQQLHRLFEELQQLPYSAYQGSENQLPAWLHSSITSQPRTFFSALAALHNETLLTTRILPCLSTAEINLLLRQADAAKLAYCTAFTELLQKAAAIAALKAPAAKAAAALPRLALATLLLQPSLQPRQFMRVWLQQLLLSFSSAERELLQHFAEAAPATGQLTGILQAAASTAGRSRPQLYQPAFLQRIKILRPATRQKLLAQLAADFNSTAFTALRQQNGTVATALLNIVLPGGSNFMNGQLNQYSRWLEQKGIGTAAAILPRLRHLFWKTLVNLPAHSINQQAAAGAFAVAAAAHYTYSSSAAAGLPQAAPAYQNRQRTVRINGTDIITEDQLLHLITQCFNTDGRPAVFEGRQYELPHLLAAALHQAPARLRSSLLPGFQPQHTAAVLSAAIHFSEWGVWCMHDSSSLHAGAMADLTRLHTLAESLLTGAALTQWEQQCWMLSLEVMAGTAAYHKKMVALAAAMYEAAVTGGSTAAAAIEAQLSRQLNKAQGSFTALLREALPGISTGGSTAAPARHQQQHDAPQGRYTGSPASSAKMTEQAAATTIANSALPRTGTTGRATPETEQQEAANEQLPAAGSNGAAATWAEQRLAEAFAGGLLSALTAELITMHTIPCWFDGGSGITPSALFSELLQHYPQQALQAWYPVQLNPAQLEWVSSSTSFSIFAEALSTTEKSKRQQLTILQDFHRALATLSIRNINGHTLQAWLFTKTIRAWQQGSWRMLAPENILNELLWELHTKQGISKNSFADSFTAARALLPPAIQAAFTLLFRRQGSTVPPAAAVKPAAARPAAKKATQQAESILVKNAGIVLLNSYIPLLFQRLGMLENNAFTQPGIQEDAVHYLQYLVTAQTYTEESYLPLNKLLCGLALDTPVKNGIDIEPAHKEVMEGMLRAAISYWPAIGQNSADGFRGNWLVRDGHLSEQDDNWQLLVDKRSYDILIGKSPFSFSVIKFPWMPKPLKVTWPY